MSGEAAENLTPPPIEFVSGVKLEIFSLQLDAISDKLGATYEGHQHMMELGARVGALSKVLADTASKKMEVAALKKEQETLDGFAQV
jgi:hypothetical protein